MHLECYLLTPQKVLSTFLTECISKFYGKWHQSEKLHCSNAKDLFIYSLNLFSFGLVVLYLTYTERKKWSQNGSRVEPFSCPQNDPHWKVEPFFQTAPQWSHFGSTFFQCITLCYRPMLHYFFLILKPRSQVCSLVTVICTLIKELLSLCRQSRST